MSQAIHLGFARRYAQWLKQQSFKLSQQNTIGLTLSETDLRYLIIANL